MYYSTHMAILEGILGRSVRTEEGCRLWLGCVATETGYSKISHDGEIFLGHRLVFALAIRELKPGEHVDHACHNESPGCVGGRNCLHRRCLEPSHLEAVTQAENNRRARIRVAEVAGARTNTERGTCRKGLHPWIPENIGSNGTNLICKPCKREVQRAYELRVAAAVGRTMTDRPASRKS